jgi:hypothetical protein
MRLGVYSCFRLSGAPNCCSGYHVISSRKPTIWMHRRANLALRNRMPKLRRGPFLPTNSVIFNGETRLGEVGRRAREPHLWIGLNLLCEETAYAMLA